MHVYGNTISQMILHMMKMMIWSACLWSRLIYHVVLWPAIFVIIIVIIGITYNDNDNHDNLQNMAVKSNHLSSSLTFLTFLTLIFFIRETQFAGAVAFILLKNLGIEEM